MRIVTEQRNGLAKEMSDEGGLPPEAWEHVALNPHNTDDFFF